MQIFKKKTKGVAINSSLASRIPYGKCCEEEGIIYSGGRYTKMYLVDDIRPENVQDYDQTVAIQLMENLLNAFPSDLAFQFLVHNKLIDEEQYMARVLLDPKKVAPELRKSVEDYDRVIVDNIDIGHNNVHKTLYFVIGVKADVAEDAIAVFRSLDAKIKEVFSKMYGITIKGLTLVARLKVMYTIFNPEKGGFGDKIRLSDDEQEIDLGNLKYMKLTTKDLVAPTAWNSSDKLIDHTILNWNTDKQQYTRSFYLNSVPREVSSSFVSDLTSVSSSMLFSAVYEPVDSQVGFDAANEAVKNNTIVTNKSKRDTVADRKSKKQIRIEEFKEYTEKAYFERSALETFKEAVAESSKTFKCTFAITLYNADIDALDKDTELLHISAAKFNSSINCLDMQQVKGFQTCLPLCHSFIDASRILDTKRLARMSPIGVQDAAKKDGLFCGLNGINDTLILLNRKNNLNLSGMIAGTEHSGKTYQMKREIFNALISCEDTMNIIATTDEYDDFAKKLGGEVIEFGLTDIFETEDGYGLLEEDISFKKMFYDALFVSLQQFSKNHMQAEAEALGEKVEEEIEKLVDYIVQNDATGRDIVAWIDEHRSELPYLVDDLNKLQAGDYHKSLKEAEKRLVVYKVKQLPEMLMVLDFLWNKTIKNKKNNHSNWIFIDDADSILRVTQSADYFTKYLTNTSQLQTITTFVIQDSVKLINNSAYVVELERTCQSVGYIKLLNQGPIERKKYSELFNIPSALMGYISNVEPGKGLIMSSASNTAFNDNFVELYPDSPFKDLFTKEVKQALA